MASTSSVMQPDLSGETIEREVANIGNLTITVERSYGKYTRERRVVVNIITYADHIAFDAEVAREVVGALNKAIIIAEGLNGK